LSRKQRLTEALHWTNKGKLRRSFAEYRILYFATSALDPSRFRRKFDSPRQYITLGHESRRRRRGSRGTCEPEIGTSHKNRAGWQPYAKHALLL